MKVTTFSCFVIIGCVFLNGCYYAQLFDGKAQFSGQAIPASVLELVEAQRLQSFTQEQVAALHELQEPQKRSRQDVYEDATFIQTLMDGRYASGTISNRINEGITLDIFEQDDDGNKSRFVQRLYLGPREKISYLLENGKKYIFEYWEKNFVHPKTWKFQNPAQRGWVCAYAPA